MAVLTLARKARPIGAAEANTFKLPRGEKLRREVRGVFRDQRAAVLRFLRTGRKAIDWKAVQARDSHGRFAGGSGWSNPEVRPRKRKRSWDTREDPAPARLVRATERLAAIFEKHPVHTTPALHDPKSGETITVHVVKNAYHFGYHGEPKYRMRTVGSRTGLNDSQGFNNLDRAVRAADSWHRALVRDGLKPKSGGILETKDDGDAIPFAWPDWNDFSLGALKISERMTPVLTLTWEAAAAKFAPKIGLDPDEWSVVNPHTERMIDEAALAFCGSMNATTSLQLDDALEKTREALKAGIVEQGESVEVLTKRINAIFDSAEKWRARRIAQTETSRAVHAAQEEAAKASGVVTGWTWLLSSDACPLCNTLARRVPAVRLGHAFAVVGDNPHYSTIKHPPAHPHCNCTLLEVLDTDVQPKWADTLHQPVPETADLEEPNVAPLIPKPRDVAKPKPAAPKRRRAEPAEPTA